MEFLKDTLTINGNVSITAKITPYWPKNQPVNKLYL